MCSLEKNKLCAKSLALTTSPPILGAPSAILCNLNCENKQKKINIENNAMQVNGVPYPSHSLQCRLIGRWPKRVFLALRGSLWEMTTLLAFLKCISDDSKYKVLKIEHLHIRRIPISVEVRNLKSFPNRMERLNQLVNHLFFLFLFFYLWFPSFRLACTPPTSPSLCSCPSCIVCWQRIILLGGPKLQNDLACI